MLLFFAALSSSFGRWHLLYFSPLPHQQRSFRPGFAAGPSSSFSPKKLEILSIIPISTSHINSCANWNFDYTRKLTRKTSFGMSEPESVLFPGVNNGLTRAYGTSDGSCSRAGFPCPRSIAISLRYCRYYAPNGSSCIRAFRSERSRPLKRPF